MCMYFSYLRPLKPVAVFLALPELMLLYCHSNQSIDIFS